MFCQEGSGACQHPNLSISDKSHSWLANSSPLEVTRMQFIIDLTVCKLKLLAGQLSVSGL